MFEVTKAEEEEKSSNSPPASPSGGSNMAGQSHGPPTSKPSALRVTIPSELQGVAYIEVICQKGKYDTNTICTLMKYARDTHANKRLTYLIRSRRSV